MRSRRSLERTPQDHGEATIVCVELVWLRLFSGNQRNMMLKVEKNFQKFCAYTRIESLNGYGQIRLSRFTFFLDRARHYEALPVRLQGSKHHPRVGSILRT